MAVRPHLTAVRHPWVQPTNRELLSDARWAEMAGRPVILTVDDDPAVSRAVARDLRRRYSENYRIVRAESGREALAALRELALRGERAALLLADHRMPEMDGVQFLEKAMDVFPAARRVLLTAYADTDAAIRAINVVDLDHYLLKPWDPPDEKLYPVLDDLLDTWRSQDRPPFEGLKVVGHRWSARSHDVRDFLARNQVPFRWLDAADDAEGRRLVDAAGAGTPDTLPLVLTQDGQTLVGPDNRELAAAIGLVHVRRAGVLRPGRGGCRPGRARCGRLRRERRVADAARRAGGARWPGGPELAHRELPRVPGRPVRR